MAAKNLLFMAAAASASSVASTQGGYPTADPLAACPGYKASNIKTTSHGLSADLTLAGQSCDVYGEDLDDLVLTVSYETDSRLHVKIQDAANNVYQVPDSVFPRPQGQNSDSDKSALKFEYTESPFSFTVSRAESGEVLFDTSAANIVFESQYLRLRTALPEDPYLYGLGEHSDAFRLNTTDYHRTFWGRDAYGVPENSNLYGNHPIYYEHRESGSHAVFLLNSNGMDVMIDKTAEGEQYLEYNSLGGVLDFYFMAGPDPIAVTEQYAEVAGLPAAMPYWGLGFHNCRYGYRDAFDVAEVVQNYSNAAIPLETMWTDIDYMYRRRVFSLDPERFPLHMMRGLVDKLHEEDQHYVVMVDPAIAEADFPSAYSEAIDDNVLLLRSNGSAWRGVVWPGVSVFPDWFSDNISSFWEKQFNTFFDAETGVDIDALWIDMNEPSNFPCYFPCDNPDEAAIGYPPEPPAVRSPPRELPGWPCDFQPDGTDCEGKTDVSPESLIVPDGDKKKREHHHQLTRSRDSPEEGQQMGLPGRDLLFPKYSIHNTAAYKVSWNAEQGGLSNMTVNTDVLHSNGLAMYDTHNIYGSMMSIESVQAMSSRRPDKRPLVITRSTFAGAGRKVGHWLGDNVSTWQKYRTNIRTSLQFASMYQIPMVGADVCGFGLDTTEQLCSRWAMLGAFNTFFRNHNNYEMIPQEFYRWESVAKAARKAIDIRYRLLDYIYTAMMGQSETGTPTLYPMHYLYPSDKGTWALELQYFYGPNLLVAPVTDQDSDSVEVYLPRDVFYDWYTHEKIEGKGETLLVENQGWDDIPLFLRGGTITPLRTSSAMTTTKLREEDFELIVAVGKDGKAEGDLYVDDGESVEQDAQGVTKVRFSFDSESGELQVEGKFSEKRPVPITKVTFLGLSGSNNCKVMGKVVEAVVDELADKITVPLVGGKMLGEEFVVQVLP